jgi:hypothetical protein
VEKHKYLSYFDYFSLQSNTIFGSLNCDYTQLHQVKLSKLNVIIQTTEPKVKKPQENDVKPLTIE